jgi:hypothetical protein
MSDFLNDIQCDELVNGQSFDGQYVPTEQDLLDMNEAWDNEPPADENFFCANCGHVELVGYALSPDSNLCCDCYKYNNDNDCGDYVETEADVYQDSSYDDEPNGWSDHLEGYDD